MIKLYLKQAWTLIKQNKLFTSIYVVGTGLSIALTMTMFIIFYVKFAPIYPEYNRDRMLTIKAMKCYPKTNKESWNCNGGASYYLVDKMLKDLPHLEAIGAGKQDFMVNNTIALPDKKEVMEVNPYYADSGFWSVFSFRFLTGNILPSMVRSFVCVELCKMCRMPLLIRQVTYGYLCFYTHGCPERLRVRN